MADQTAGNVLVPNWGPVALRGVAALIFGLITLFNPALSLAALIFVFGAYAIVDGLFAIIAALATRGGRRHWVVFLISGLLSIALGVLTFAYPGVTAVVLLYFIAAWALVAGIGQIIAAIRLRKVITGEWVMILTGVLSIALGVVLVLAPGAGALAVTLWIGAYATVLGVLLLVPAFRLRSWWREHAGDRTLRPA